MVYTASKMAEKLGISRSYLYYLKENNAVEICEDENGRFIWDDAAFIRLSEYLELFENPKKIKKEILPYKTINISNRRFLGNKYKLVPFINAVVKSQCKDINVVADIFSGTGSACCAFTDKKLILNDLLYSCYICNLAWFGSEEFSREKIIKIIEEYNAQEVTEENYMSENFADTYFSAESCRKIGFIREDIEEKFKTGQINERERALLITSLLYAMDKIANTCGHYDAYRQGAEFTRKLELAVPVCEKGLSFGNICFNKDANELVREISADLVYIDPPYNSRQYCDAYHLLENVARWEKPEVTGVARKMDRQALKSDYCTKKAPEAFEELILSINAKYILLSYNNMAEKGDDRSNAKITDEQIMNILSRKGTVKVFEQDYKTFSAGKSDIKGNKERLFLCECFDYKKDIIPSALNYIGGKYKLLPQLLPCFPENCDVVLDLFCGGANVGINLPSGRVIFNDCNEYIIGILSVFSRLPAEKVFDFLYKKIEACGLSLSSKYGYRYYNCESSAGLAAYNREAFGRLKDAFNKISIRDDEYYLTLYLLIVYSFNNQIRFNKKGEFNLPVGKRDFNEKMQRKLKCFINRLQSGNYTFINNDFKKIDTSFLTEKSFVYADPPYLITCAGYNEASGWTQKDERDLLSFLDTLNSRGIRFALSNVLESKGKTNEILKEWINKNTGKYKVIELDYSYSNSNYHAKNRDKQTREVLIVNYG